MVARPGRRCHFFPPSPRDPASACVSRHRESLSGNGLPEDCLRRLGRDPDCAGRRAHAPPMEAARYQLSEHAVVVRRAARPEDDAGTGRARGASKVRRVPSECLPPPKRDGPPATPPTGFPVVFLRRRGGWGRPAQPAYLIAGGVVAGGGWPAVSGSGPPPDSTGRQSR